MEKIYTMKIQRLDKNSGLGLARVSYDALIDRFYIHYAMFIDQWGDNPIIFDNAFIPYSYHDFSQLLKLKSMQFLRFYFKRWEWRQLITNLWYKSLNSNCTGHYRLTRKAREYIIEFPEGCIEFTDRYNFKINLLNEDYGYISKFIDILSTIQFKTYEFDMTLSEDKKSFIVSMIKDRETEPQ